MTDHRHPELSDAPVDDDLRAELRRLPAAGASPGFTRRVLARLDEAEVPRATGPEAGRLIPRWAPRAAAAAAVVVMLLAASLLLPAFLGDDGGRSAEGPRTDPGAAAAAPSRLGPEGGEQVAAVDLEAPEVPLQDPPVEASPPTAPAADDDAGVGEEGAEGARGGETPRRAGEAAPRSGRRAAPGSTGDPEPAGRVARHSGDDDAGSGAATARTVNVAERRSALARIAELEQRRRELRGELAALSAVSRHGRAPTLLLAGDESVELVLDLDRTADTGVAPAAHRPGPSRDLL